MGIIIFILAGIIIFGIWYVKTKYKSSYTKVPTVSHADNFNNEKEPELQKVETPTVRHRNGEDNLDITITQTPVQSTATPANSNQTTPEGVAPKPCLVESTTFGLEACINKPEKLAATNQSPAESSGW